MARTQGTYVNDPNLGRELTVAEYSSLRNEILKLIELQSQLITFAVIAFGAVVSFGIQVDNALIMLVYPILAMIIAASWMNHAHSIHRCAAYIREKENELGLPMFAWETFVAQKKLPAGWIGFWGVRAVFAISAVLAILASLTIEPPQGGGLAFFFLSSLAGLATIVMTVAWREDN